MGKIDKSWESVVKMKRVRGEKQKEEQEGATTLGFVGEDSERPGKERAA